MNIRRLNIDLGDSSVVPAARGRRPNRVPIKVNSNSMANTSGLARRSRMDEASNRQLITTPGDVVEAHRG